MILQLILEFTLYVPGKNLVFCIKEHLASSKDIVDERYFFISFKTLN